MIKDAWVLKEELSSEYHAPKNKIQHLEQQQKLVKVVRGLYETDASTPGYLLSSSIYGPSYLSFEYALSYWQMIPEKVMVYTSATFRKNRKKLFQTSFGVFSYQDVPSEVYPMDIRIQMENNRSFLIASPEKALCDTLYAKPVLSRKSDLEAFLFENLRLDQEIFETLDVALLIRLSSLYGKTNLRFFADYISKRSSQ